MRQATKIKTPEKNIHKQVAEYLRRQYPKVLFRSDSGAGMRLTIGQAMQQKRIQNGDAWPDLQICEPRTITIKPEGGIPISDMLRWRYTGEFNQHFFGLFLELKKEGYKLFKKDGSPVNDHIKAQAECLAKLEEKGYRAKFCCGFYEAKTIIDNYLK